MSIHAALANSCDRVRDGPYLITRVWHPAFGYVDRPPLVPLIAAGAYGLAHAPLRRLVPILVLASAADVANHTGVIGTPVSFLVNEVLAVGGSYRSPATA